MNLTSQQIVEIDFWKNLYLLNGEDKFLEIRRKDWFDKTEFLKNI
jgi:hypothetical protein